MAKNMDTSMKERIFRGTGWAWGYGMDYKMGRSRWKIIQLT